MPHVYPRAALLCGLTFVVPLGCNPPPVEAPKTTVEQQTGVATSQNIKDKVDLLFLIDDSGSMSPKQEALKAKFDQLTSVLEDFAEQGNPASYHIGVVTSDLGAKLAGNKACGANLGGALQNRGLAQTNAAGCKGPVDAAGNPAYFIDYDQKTQTNNFPPGQKLPDTFRCMATVVDPNGTMNGHQGCGFEMQLEAVYRALHDKTIAHNRGFLRDDAILVVVFITDEDDCSVDDPSSDLFSGTDDKYGPLTSFRCAQYGVVCDGELVGRTPSASYKSCVPATTMTGGKLAELKKYVDFFTKPTGVKRDPDDVIVAAILARPDSFSTMGEQDKNNCGGSATSCTLVRTRARARPTPTSSATRRCGSTTSSRRCRTTRSRRSATATTRPRSRASAPSSRAS